jgi:hypothetical protein
MVDYTIVPRNNSYWLEAMATDGSRRTIERFKTEAEAVKRLHDLQENAGVIKPRFGMLPPRDRY